MKIAYCNWGMKKEGYKLSMGYYGQCWASYLGNKKRYKPQVVLIYNRLNRSYQIHTIIHEIIHWLMFKIFRSLEPHHKFDMFCYNHLWRRLSENPYKG